MLDFDPLKVGDRFGLLTVTGRSTIVNRKTKFWECRCDCGNVRWIKKHQLRNGQVKSCGCLRAKRFLKHGHARTTEHMIWRHMKHRCSNPHATGYHRYRGRGISVCERWRKSFEDFYADMGPRPSPGHTLDRINNDGNYEPSNCRWATKLEQSKNKSVNVPLTIDGETKIVAEWSRVSGVGRQVIYGRLKCGWSPKDAVFSPVRG